MALELQRIDPWDGDTNSGTTYYGYATAGTQDTDAFWSISRKVIIDSVLVYQYPYTIGTILQNANPAIEVGNVPYMNLSGLIWANRTGYTYR